MLNTAGNVFDIQDDDNDLSPEFHLRELRDVAMLSAVDERSISRF
jgi:hypothetical protein